jgi:hypothetical protein
MSGNTEADRLRAGIEALAKEFYDEALRLDKDHTADNEAEEFLMRGRAVAYLHCSGRLRALLAAGGIR